MKHHILSAVLLLSLPALALAIPPAKPTDPHTVLHKEVGTWKTETTWWPKGPDGPVFKCTGTEINETIGDGLWVVREFSGKLGEHTYEGSGQYGYNPKTKKYLGTWVDSISFHVTIMEGTYDAEKNELIMHSEKQNHEGDVFESRSVTTYDGDDKKSLVIYAKQPDGKEFKMFEATSVRQAAK